MQLDDIQFEEKLGSGGFGEVYKATAEHFSGPVAIKLLKVPDESARRRLVREVKLLSSLDHKNIIPILAHQLEVDPIWFAMPLGDGSLLDRMISSAIPRQNVHDYFLQILDGVEYAHAHANRIIHRDLKPENILLFGDDLLISDFGIGKPLERSGLYSTVTQFRVGIGSPGYVAPEQWADIRDANEQADIFSLGMILYTMVANSIPNPTHDITRIPRQYHYIIQRCAHKTPDERFASVVELRQKFLSAIDRSSFRTASPDEDRLAYLFSVACAPELANDVLRIFFDNGDKSSLYKSCFPQMTRDYIEHFSQTGWLDDFKHILLQFDEHVSGSLNFQYCNTVADFLMKVLEVCNDVDVFRLLLERLLVMGVMHNRRHVMDVFCAVICRLTVHDPSKTMTAVEVIERHPNDFRILYSNKSSILSKCSLPRVLRSAIGRIVAESTIE